MRYELLIQKNGEYIPVDLGDDAPVMVLQVNTLIELKDINSSYSQSLSLPVSDVNCEAFDYVDNFHARSAFPYRVYPCELYCDGARLLEEGFKLVVKNVTGDWFKCQIVSGVNGLFSELGNLTMSDLGLPLIPYTLDEVQASSNGLRDYVFAFSLAHHRRGSGFSAYGFDPEAATEQARRDEQYGLTMLYCFWPYFRLRSLVEKILAAQGYTLDAPLSDVPGYKDAYVSLADMKPSATSFDPLRATVNVNTVTASSFTTEQFLLHGGTISANYGEVDTVELHAPELLQTPSGAELVDVYGKCYTATDTVTVRVRMKTTCATDYRIMYRVRRYGILLSETLPVIGGVRTTDFIDFENHATAVVTLTRNDVAALPNGEWVSEGIDLSPGEKICIEANLLSAVTAGVAINTTMQIDFNPDDNKVPAGGNIDPGINFDFKNQLEAVRLFVQLHGLTTFVDFANKVVRMRRFDALTSKAVNNVSVDWSDKLDLSRTPEVAFTLEGYTQRNDVRYKVNDMLSIQDTAGLTVDNRNIATDKIMLDLQPLSSANRNIRNPVVANPVIWQDCDVMPRYFADMWAYAVYINRVELQDEEGNSTGEYVNVWPQLTYAIGASLWNPCPILKYERPGMHIVEINPMQVAGEPPRVGYIPYNMQNPATAKRLLSNAKVAKYIPVSHFVETYYAELQNRVLNRVRVLTAYFYLTPDDVANLDLFTPVYVDAYGGYFYIQKIDNYRADTVTKVSLIAINL